MKGKNRLLIIGDYSNESQLLFTRKLCNRLNDYYDIIVSGHSVAEIQCSKTICTKKMNSVEYNFYTEMAEVVVITDMFVKYTKKNNRQKIVFVTNCVQEHLDTIIDARVDFLVTNESNDNLIIENTIIDSSHIYYYQAIDDCVTPIEEIDSIIDWIFERVCQGEFVFFPDILFFSLNKAKDLIYYNPEIQLFLNDIDRINGGNLGLVSPFEYQHKLMGVSLQYNYDERLQELLKEYHGVLVFDNNQTKEILTPWLEKIGNSNLFNNILTMKQLSLFPLYEEYSEKVAYLLRSREGFDENNEYKSLLERLYIINNCADICISVIICRYNTEIGLLFRAIDSVFKSTHKNIEIVLVDDGSKDNIENIIDEKYVSIGKNIKYYYKNNEGIGISRNFGVDKASGTFLFFLDSDDTITYYGLELLLAHAIHFKLDVVCGKRVLCNEDGSIINESLPALMGNTYRVYGRNMPGDGINDCMVNNKLINREFVISNGIRFIKGVYEDVEYSSKLYSVADEFHIVNIHIHNWYQYDSMDTLSSTVTFENFIERYEKTTIAWRYTPEHLRPNRLSSIINSEMARYFVEFNSFDEKEQLLIWKKVSEFVIDRIDYIDESKLSLTGSMLVQAAMSDDIDHFLYVINRFYLRNRSNQSYDNYIVFTHYHILTAISYAIKRKKPCRLFLGKGYSTFSRQFVNRLRHSAIFDEIIEFNNSAGVDNLYEGLSERPNDAYVLVPSCLNIPYSSVFKMCNFREDTLFFVSDTLPYWYFVERNFEKIVKLEDAYNSFPRELVKLEIWGKWSCIKPYMGNLFPPSYFQSEKIKAIVVSNRVDDIPDGIKEKIVIRDTKDIISENREEIKRIILELYDFDATYLDRNTVMILTQPLALYQYCTKKEQKKLYRKICKKNKHKTIVIKPHPADNMNYSDLGTVMNKSMPIEVLNFADIRISKVITFGSSAIETVEFADEKIAMFPMQGFERKDVIDAIQKYTRDNAFDLAIKIIKKTFRVLRRCINP